MSNSKIQLLELSGEPFERGVVHGEKYASQIKEAIRILKTIIRLDVDKEPDKYFSTFYEKQNFIPSIKQHTPDLWEELEGLAKGSKCSIQDIFIMQLGDDFFAYTGDFGTSMGAVRCSSLGVEHKSNKPSIIGQNLDWDLSGEGSHLVLKINDPKTEISSIVIATPGVIGTMGVNNKSVSICTNAIWTQTNNSLTGLPVTFVLRGVLDCSTYEEAVTFIKSVKHATGENYIIGDKDNVGCFECSPNKVAEYIPMENPKRVFHTNHVLVNDDLPFPPRPGKAKPAGPCRRFQYLEYTLGDSAFCPDMDGFKEILRSHIGEICRHHNYTLTSGFTWSSAIFELSDKPKAFFTPGPPCESEYQEFSF